MAQPRDQSRPFIAGGLGVLLFGCAWLVPRALLGAPPVWLHVLTGILALAALVAGGSLVWREPEGGARAARQGALVMTVLVLGLRDMLDDWLHRRPFDAAAWRAEDATAARAEWPPRLRMVHHLLWTRGLRGRPRSELVELLGGDARSEASGMSYSLGPLRRSRQAESWGDGVEYLRLAFDERDVCTDVRIEEGWADRYD